MRAYLAGELKAFTVPMRQPGTPFQKKVWEELVRIPFGETISYRQLAKRVGKPLACRAVGSANGRNQLIVAVPCHRVIAADGTLGGYGGGLWRKEWLLAHERK
jgi:methylated-DNA-[protein]-cysteine S-methyltransferase